MSDFKDENDDVTRIDLGEDLLSESEKVQKEVHQENKDQDPNDALRSANILLSEGLVDEAKTVIREVYRKNPHNKELKIKLDEIQEIEINKIINEQDNEKIVFKRQKKKRKELKLDSDKVMRELDKDLNLGIFREQNKALPDVAELSLFKDKEGMEEFEANLRKALVGSKAKDKLDTAIAFIEMGLYKISINILLSAKKQVEKKENNKNEMINTVSILAFAYIENGSPYKAIMEIQNLIEDREVEVGEKVELYYLMGKANAELGKKKESIMWYLKTAHIDKNYRNVQEILQKK